MTLIRRSSQVKCLIPISQRAAKAVRAKTLRVLVVFCSAAPPVFRLPDGLITYHSTLILSLIIFLYFFCVILSKKTCASRRVIGVSFHLSLPLDSFQLGLLFRPEMLSPVPSLHRVEFCCGFLFGVTSLLVRGEGHPCGSWIAWRWRYGGGVLLHTANCSPMPSVSSEGAPRLKICRQVVLHKSFLERTAPGHLRTSNRTFVINPSGE